MNNNYAFGLGLASTIFLVIGLSIGYIISPNIKPIEKETIYIPVKDSISEKSNIAKIVELEYKLKLTQDSLYSVKDSLGTDLFVAKYKLERIKRYNKIAAKGNNIKYLRGWINRVINE